MTGVLIKRGNLDVETDPRRIPDDIKVDMGWNRKCPRDAKKCQQTTPSKESIMEQSLPQNPQTEPPSWHLDHRLLASRTEAIDLCGLSHPDCGTADPWTTQVWPCKPIYRWTFFNRKYYSTTAPSLDSWPWRCGTTDTEEPPIWGRPTVKLHRNFPQQGGLAPVNALPSACSRVNLFLYC